MSTAGAGGVFVSYRRDDAADMAGRLADILAHGFGAERVFIDVETIELGVDFVEVTTSAVGACEVLVAVIGPSWLTAAGRRGRRLDEPEDWVRLEIGTALSRGVRVIPVLVGGATMPPTEELPDDLAGLARRNALRVRSENFRDDTRRLIDTIERVLASAAAADSIPAGRPIGGAFNSVADEGAESGRGAACLLGEAERIANSITIETSKAAALAGIANALAAARG